MSAQVASEFLLVFIVLDKPGMLAIRFKVLEELAHFSQLPGIDFLQVWLSDAAIKENSWFARLEIGFPGPIKLVSSTRLSHPVGRRRCGLAETSPQNADEYIPSIDGKLFIDLL